MKIKKGFLMREVAGENVVIAVGEAAKSFKGMIRLNPSGAFLWQLLEKDTDEISVDKTFVADQSPLTLEKAIRQIIAANNALERAQQTAFKPMISKPVVPVELKIVGILKRMDKGGGRSTLKEILEDSVSLPDLIAIF